MMPARCPRCGAQGPLFDLLPDESRTLASISCPECRRKPVPPLVGEPARASCSHCGAPIYTNWAFCTCCARPLVKGKAAQ